MIVIRLYFLLQAYLSENCLLCDFCPSDQRFAYGFFQISLRDEHPCRLAIHFPLSGYVRDFHPLEFAHAGQTKSTQHLYCVLHQIHIQLFKLAQTMPNCHSQKTRERRAEKHPKNRLSVNHFGNHFPLFSPSFWPVNHLRTTKNWMKSALVLPNLVKPYQPV